MQLEEQHIPDIQTEQIKMTYCENCKCHLGGTNKAISDHLEKEHGIHVRMGEDSHLAYCNDCHKYLGKNKHHFNDVRQALEKHLTKKHTVTIHEGCMDWEMKQWFNLNWISLQKLIFKIIENETWLDFSFTAGIKDNLFNSRAIKIVFPAIEQLKSSHQSFSCRQTASAERYVLLPVLC